MELISFLLRVAEVVREVREAPVELVAAGHEEAAGVMAETVRAVRAARAMVVEVALAVGVAKGVPVA